ncbi:MULTISPECIES: hypothetical protein [unclassified Blastococcus]
MARYRLIAGRRTVVGEFEAGDDDLEAMRAGEPLRRQHIEERGAPGEYYIERWVAGDWDFRGRYWDPLS